MEQKDKLDKSRVIFLVIGLSIIFLALILRIYYLQFIRGEELLSGALKQRGRQVLTSPMRGTIYDRKKRPLTNYEKVPTLLVPKKELLADKELFDMVKEGTSLTHREFTSRLNSNEGLLTLPMDEDFTLEGDRKNIFLIDIVNRYSKDNLLSHVIGYINKSDNRGESGIEKVFDEFLNIQGLDSFIVEYDKSRQIILGGSYLVNHATEPNNPSGVQLTIDKEIQELVEEIMDRRGHKGSVIVAEVETGDILAMVSRPNFDQDRIEDQLKDENMALFNRAIQVTYPPGSIFKIVVLLTALEEEPAAIKEEYYCKGFEEINGIITKCNGYHGNISLEEGFAESCNSVFIQLTKELGPKKVIRMARKLGLEERVNIGLLGEKPGNLPKDNELLGAAVGNVALGQGKIEVTPLQITRLMMTVVNKGIYKPLAIIRGITNQEGQLLKEYNREDEGRIISEEASLEILKMLRQVVLSGTGKNMDLEDLGGAGGKTGSAEGVLRGQEVIHGWFSGYFPNNKPKYVITVAIEDAESGSETAAPIFEEIAKAIVEIDY